MRQIEEQTLDGWEREIIVVNDCSNDKTAEVLESLRGEFNFILLNHSENLGKGKAIRTALSRVSGDYIIIQDADLEYTPSDWPHLIQELENPEVKVVFGTREGAERHGYFHYVLGVRFLTFLTNLLFRSRLTDIYTCYKLIPSELMKSIPFASSGFEFEAEITAQILKRKFIIKEVPINYFPRSFEEGKKIRFRDGIIGIFTIIKNRF